MTNVPLSPAPDSPANLAVEQAGNTETELNELDELELKLEQVPCPTKPGFVTWRLAGREEPRTTLPQLRPHPPPRVWRGYLAKALSILTGTCPNCRQTAWIAANAPDPEHTPVGWSKLEVSVGIQHAPGCGAVFEERDRKWFDPRSVEQR